jgi:hypothetical protein
MSFNRQRYIDVYNFAEKIFLASRRGATELSREAEEIMDACEDVIGQIRPPEERHNTGRFSDIVSRRPS